ncbi:von Willebrand factor, type A [Trichophyton rubrum]|nr:von Willebrand factor, type A [Trichophyton rubrum]
MDSTHSLTDTPTPKPLEISKIFSKANENAAASVKKNACSPCRIPRRRSSHVVRPPLIPLSTTQNVVKSNKPIPARQHQRLHKATALHPKAMENLTAEKRVWDGRASSADVRQRQPTPKGPNILSRAINALDFRSRECSGNEADNTTRAHGFRLPSLQKASNIRGRGSEVNLRGHTGIQIGKKSCNGLYEKAQIHRHQALSLVGDNLLAPKAHDSIATIPRIPRHIPITSAAVNLVPNSLKSSPGQDKSTWISAVITASINDFTSGANISGPYDADIPLDVMILVDNSARVSEGMLKAACRNAFQLTSVLDILIDRIAICCISPDPTQNLNILMPLSSYSLDTVEILFRSLPAFQLPHGESSRSRLAGAIKEASNYIIRHSSREASCHMFLVSAGSTVLIPGESNGDKLRYHTISPENAVMINSRQSLEGWHIGTNFGSEEQSVDLTFRSKLQFAIQHLRIGVDSGYLHDLELQLEAGPDSEIEAILGDTNRSVLRLGESWTVLVKVKPIPELQGPFNSCLTTTNSENEPHTPNESTVDRMIDQLQGMLKPASCTLNNECRITASLEYKHSALSGNTILLTRNKFTVPRFRKAVTWDDSVKPPAPRSNSAISHRQIIKPPIDSEIISVKKRQQFVSNVVGNDHQSNKFGKEIADEASAMRESCLPYRDMSPFGSMNPYKDICKHADPMASQQYLGRIPEYGHLHRLEDPFARIH